MRGLKFSPQLAISEIINWYFSQKIGDWARPGTNFPYSPEKAIIGKIDAVSIFMSEISLLIKKHICYSSFWNITQRNTMVIARDYNTIEIIDRFPHSLVFEVVGPTSIKVTRNLLLII